MSGYPYDAEVRDRVTEILFRALPRVYRVGERREADTQGLREFLQVLAAPLAVLRQNIEELHADLFIDTGHDQVIPLLAEMVGTALVFPDADANRRDVRGTVGWRRRKGSPRMLQEMGQELTAQLVITQEGWKRLQLAQDLNLPRLARVIPDLRPAIVAEQAAGPLDALFHAVDVRAISEHSGRYHPKHVVHWIHPTITFPLRRVTAVDEALPGSDQRFSMHPLGEWRPLRARGTADAPIDTDRVPELHFAARPGAWFGVEGRFGIELCGLPAALPELLPLERVASSLLADLELVRGIVGVTLLAHDSRAFQGPVTLDVGLAAFVDSAAGSWHVDVTSFESRASLELDGAGVLSVASNPGPSGARALVLRVRPSAGVGGRFFPGATLAIHGSEAAAETSAVDAELAREGFLRGALHVTVPACQVVQERWFLLAADGSVYDAEQGASGTAPAEMPSSGGRRQLHRARLLAPGPGPAWPPLPPSAEPSFVTQLPAAPGRGPCVMHGGRVVRSLVGGVAFVAPGTRCALVFAMRVEQAGAVGYRPFQRLEWSGPDPANASWRALAPNGVAVGADFASVDAVYGAIAALRESSGARFPLAVRFECALSSASLCPAEVAWTTDDGTTLLIHLPQLDASSGSAEAWPADVAFSSASAPLRVAEDGSTWAAASTANARLSLGAVAPLRGSTSLRRRRVGWRRLCAWQNEDRSALPPRVLAATRPGWLDVDVRHGLFSLATDDTVQLWPADADGRRPSSVTSSFEEGATLHIGARPDAREPVLDQQLERPTRIVTGSGHLSANAPAAWYRVPRYASVSEALAAISATWENLAPIDVPGFDQLESFTRAEVIQIEDSGTYAEAPVWPTAPLDPAVAAKARFALTLQAAERERPHLLLEPLTGWRSPAVPARLAQLSVIGIALGGEGVSEIRFPPLETARIALSTILYPENRLVFRLDEQSELVVLRSELASVLLEGTGEIAISDSIVDATSSTAMEAPSGRVRLERVTVGGPVLVHELHASEVIFDDVVQVQDRFHGCVRHSRVAAGSVLPSAHRVVTDVRVDYVSLDRHDPAWRRLRADADRRVLAGAEDGSEMGAFATTRHAARIAAFERRREEYTPAGLVSGTVRRD